MFWYLSKQIIINDGEVGLLSGKFVHLSLWMYRMKNKLSEKMN